MRKVFYNITITGLSVAVCVGDRHGRAHRRDCLAPEALRFRFWAWFESTDINLLGFVIVGMFVATWAIALAIWRFGHIEEKWSAHLGDGDHVTEPAGPVVGYPTSGPR